MLHFNSWCVCSPCPSYPKNICIDLICFQWKFKAPNVLGSQYWMDHFFSHQLVHLLKPILWSLAPDASFRALGFVARSQGEGGITLPICTRLTAGCDISRMMPSTQDEGGHTPLYWISEWPGVCWEMCGCWETTGVSHISCCLRLTLHNESDSHALEIGLLGIFSTTIVHIEPSVQGWSLGLFVDLFYMKRNSYFTYQKSIN